MTAHELLADAITCPACQGNGRLNGDTANRIGTCDTCGGFGLVCVTLERITERKAS